MPTILTHALLPAIAAAALPVKLPWRLTAAVMVAAMLPDVDVVGGLFMGVPHAHDFGHRGASHTLLFALMVSCFGGLCARTLGTRPQRATILLFLSSLSHPLTDMLTDGGKGIMLMWPVDGSRYKFLFTPVEASPIGIAGFTTGRIWPVLASEVLWLIVPAILLAFLVRLVGKIRFNRAPLIDSGFERP